MKKFISVFFSGTSHSLSTEYLAGSLFESIHVDRKTYFRRGFDGCGADYKIYLDYGIRGSLFASGLDEQCDSVIAKISQLIAAGDEVVLNVYGHSRGGMAAIMLAQQLSLVDPKKLEINLALMDPVPGNLIVSAYLDPFDTTLANKGMDLTDCKPLKNVLALYPYEPLPAIIFHAPLFISYPSHVKPQEVIIPGCHAGAEKTSEPETKISASLVTKFLVENGTVLKAVEFQREEILECYDEILECYDEAMKKLDRVGPQERDAHSAKGIYIDAQTGADYFNEHHRQLAKGNPNASLAVSLKQSNNPLSLLKRTPIGRVLMSVLKWTLLGLGLAALLYFTGGLAAVSFLAPAIASVGALTILAATPVLSGGLAFLWYAVVKPILYERLHQFLYPKYSLRDISPVEPSESQESEKTLSPSSESEQTKETDKKVSGKLPESGASSSRKVLLTNPAVVEMLKSETIYNKTLVNLNAALKQRELVGKNQTLLDLRQPISDLKRISDGLIENTSKGIEEKLTVDSRKALKLERHKLLLEFFNTLTAYASLYKKCMDEQSSNPQAFQAINDFLKAQVSEDGRTQLNLQTHLIEPVQRGPRYKLLIKEIQKIGTSLDQENMDEAGRMLAFIDNKLDEMNKSLSETIKPKPSAFQQKGWASGFFSATGRHTQNVDSNLVRGGKP